MFLTFSFGSVLVPFKLHYFNNTFLLKKPTFLNCLTHPPSSLFLLSISQCSFPYYFLQKSPQPTHNTTAFNAFPKVKSHFLFFVLDRNFIGSLHYYTAINTFTTFSSFSFPYTHFYIATQTILNNQFIF